MHKKGRLRSGYTTGACATAATKASLLGALYGYIPTEVEISLPDGSRHRFYVSKTRLWHESAMASVIKDAGDDPDVTHGAEIVSEVFLKKGRGLFIKGGKGVGYVTKPGLPVPLGEPAINPVPRKMIAQAVEEVLGEGAFFVEVVISVVRGEEIAKKTINERLGIVGGLSILGTTGIVRPLSSEAWTATISVTMDVARALGIDEVVLSAGRASEEAHMKMYRLPEEAYVMMGDYLEFSLKEAKQHRFKRIHLAAQWAKMLKSALSDEYLGKIKDHYGYTTHVRHGPLDIDKAIALLINLGVPDSLLHGRYNTARQLYETVKGLPVAQEIYKKLCLRVSEIAETITEGIPVNACLVGYDKRVLMTTYDQETF